MLIVLQSGAELKKKKKKMLINRIGFCKHIAALFLNVDQVCHGGVWLNSTFMEAHPEGFS